MKDLELKIYKYFSMPYFLERRYLCYNIHGGNIMSYNKLVRDNIPDIIKNNGEIPITRILNDDEYKIELEKNYMKNIKKY